MILNSNIPSGALSEKWDKHMLDMQLVSPANKKKFSIIVVGTGLAGASAAASLAEQGYNVDCFCFHDSPRRAHSIAAQGGINAAKNYQNDGDSVERLFRDTIKGGDFRSREANVYRLAQVSGRIIDQCVAQGVPLSREYSGLLSNRQFGGTLVSRTFYARGQTGQQLLLGAYSSLSRQIGQGAIKMHTYSEMLDLIVVNGKACGITTRDIRDGKIESWSAHAVVLATGGYANVFYLSTNARGCNVSAAFAAHKKGALFANPCFTQIHPTCIPLNSEHQAKLTLMSESLRNIGRVWVPKKKNDARNPKDIPESERDYYLERKYPQYGNLATRDVASRATKEVCDAGHGVGPNGKGAYLDFQESIDSLGEEAIKADYGNLFQMYEKITGENPYRVPMRIYPAAHYTMGGLWVDYNLMSNVPGLFVLGEANFSDHGANRLGASALMQGLADGYFIAPYTIGNYLASAENLAKPNTDSAEFKNSKEAVEQKLNKILSIRGKRTFTSIHKELGTLLWEHCGMVRNEAGLKKVLEKIPEIKEEFWNNVNILGEQNDYNQALELGSRVADFIDFAELLCTDALHRTESCGGHFREESQTKEGEAKRDDKNFSYVAAWEYKADGKKPVLHKEELAFETLR